jgi:hypothetical protein
MQVKAVGRQLGIAAQLKQDLEQRRVVALLKRISAKDAVAFLSGRAALDGDMIELYADHWKWGRNCAMRRHQLLSLNRVLPWSAEMIERFADLWEWKLLSKNESLPWSIELIEHFENRWDWFGLSKNEALPWSIDLINRFTDRWDTYFLSKNESVPWSADLVDRFASRTKSNNFSLNGALPWSIEFIERIKHHLDWPLLAQNKCIPWSNELIEHFEDCWPCESADAADHDHTTGWDRLSCNKALPWSIELLERYRRFWKWGALSENESLPWSTDLIEKFADRWHWGARKNGYQRHHLSKNEALPWSTELLERYEDRWHWGHLSKNAGLPWSIELFERYEDRWDWGQLSKNEALPWSIELLERYEDRWDWGQLSKNEALPWSFELVESFECRWTWHGGGLSANRALQWSIELIERFADRWTWGWLSENKGLPWSIELVESFADRWDWGSISANEDLLLPMLRTASIVEIMTYHFDCKDTSSEMGSEAGHCTGRQSEPETHRQATNVREGGVHLEADNGKIVHIDMYTPLYKRLRSWRAVTARARNAPPSAIFQDATLREIATRRPRCLEDLTGIAGLSDEDRGGYGAAILEVVNLPLYEVLRVWTAQAAKAYGIPTYEIFHDETLHKIATCRPRSLEDLERVRGVGLRALDSYGAAILELVNTSREFGEQPEGAAVHCKDDESGSIPF